MGTVQKSFMGAKLMLLEIIIIVWLISALIANHIDRKYWDELTIRWQLLNLSFGPIALAISIRYHILCKKK